MPIIPSVEDVEAPALAAAYEEKEASEEFRRYAEGDGPADDGPWKFLLSWLNDPNVPWAYFKPALAPADEHEGPGLAPPGYSVKLGVECFLWLAFVKSRMRSISGLFGL